MADPLSTTASIIAVLQLSGTIIGYLRDIKNRDSPRLRSVLRSTEGVLETLQETIEDAKLDPTENWSKTIRALDGKEGPIHQLSSTLSSIDALLQKHASGPRKFLWPFKKEELEELVQSIESQKALLALALENDHIALSKSIQRDVNDIRRDTQDIHRHTAETNRNVKDLREDTRDIHRHTVETYCNVKETGRVVKEMHQDTKEITDGMSQTQKSAQRKELVDWLSTLDFSPQLRDLLSKREEGSGQWFLTSEQYRTWWDDRGTALLCPGIPGAGKTIMASIVIEDLIDRQLVTKEKIPRVGIAYIFCTYQPRQVQKLEDLVSCLLKQLVQQMEDIPDTVTDLYELALERGIPPSFKEIQNALRSTAAQFDRVFIVVDALDELYIADNGRLFALLSTLSELQARASVNVCATSRFNSEILSQFSEGTLIKEIRADDEDVSRYINGRIPGLLSSRICRYPDLRQSIREEVLERVDGMFLLSRLHMDALAGQTSVGHIKKALKELPKGLHGLDQTYENALQRISNQIPQQRELAKKVLSWIYGAKRALSIAELQHAVAVDSTMEDLDRDFLPDVELLDALCAGLVTVDKEANVVRLVHYTTREFFERHAFLGGAADLLCQTCLTYLSLDSFSRGVCASPDEFDQRLSNYELLTYAATHWGEHLRDHTTKSAGDADSATDLAVGFLSSPELIGSVAQVLLVSEEIQITMRRIWLAPEMTGLHLVAYLGLEFLVDRLCADGARLDARDAGGLTPLAWTAVKGQYAASKALLKHMDPSCINIMDNHGRTPVLHSFMGRNETITTLLLHEGADPNLAGPGADSSVRYAIQRGHLRNIEHYTKSRKVTLNTDLSEGRSLLELALEQGETEIALALMEYGADIDYTDGTPPLFRMLAHIHHTDGTGETYLHRAIKRARANGNDTLVSDILTLRPNLEVQDRNGQTALHLAPDLGMAGVAATLLGAGANPSTPDADRLTAWMRYASRSGKFPDYQYGHIGSPFTERWSGHQSCHLCHPAESIGSRNRVPGAALDPEAVLTAPWQLLHIQHFRP